MDTRHIVFAVFVLLIDSVSSDSCQPIVESLRKLGIGYVYSYGNICYVFVNHEKTWVDARHQCEVWGGDMVHIPDVGTMDFLKNVMDNQLRWTNNGVWIGLHSRGGGGWRWTTGDKQTFSYWDSGQPSKLFGIVSFEDCANMRRTDGWKWHDYMCDNRLYTYKYICQFRMIRTTTTTKSTTTTTKSTTTATTTTVATTTKTTTATPTTTIVAAAKSIEHIYHKPSETSDATLVMQGIQSDSSMGMQVAKNMGGSNKDSDGLSDSSKGAIIGLVLGGFIVLVICSMVFILFRRRKRKKRESDNLVVQFENTDYIHGYTQGYTPVSQSEPNGHIPSSGRPESHIYMDTDEMNRLYERVTKQVDYGVNNYDQLKPKSGACGAEALEVHTDDCCEESDLKKQRVDLPEEPSQLNNANEYIDMGSCKPKLTNLEVNSRRVEKQNNLQQSEPVYSNQNISTESLHTPAEEELDVLEYEVPDGKQTDPLYDVVN